MSRKQKIILVDDLTWCSEILSEVLRDEGYEVESFSNARAVCDVFCQTVNSCKAEHACANYLLTDNRMPGISGLEMIKIQALQGCKIPSQNRAVVSGSWTEEEISQATRLKCKTFEKPYDFDAILVWLEEVANRPEHSLTE
jgi:DNA-binding NtrC family response regulator